MAEPTEQTPLNAEREERQIGAPEAEDTESSEEKSTVGELRNKLKITTILSSVLVFSILNLIMFIVGICTANDCPIRPIIPIYLAVAGALGILTKILPAINLRKEIALLRGIWYVAVTIEVIWMILGSYWVYSIYKPNYDPAQGSYCNKTAYLLAFWLLTVHYIFILLLITIPFCALCIAALSRGQYF